MSFEYRITFENGDVVEDQSLAVVQGMKAMKPGFIEQINKTAEVRLNGAILAPFETPDQASEYRDVMAQAAAQVAKEQYTVHVVKAVVEPQPEGLN